MVRLHEAAGCMRRTYNPSHMICTISGLLKVKTKQFHFISCKEVFLGDMAGLKGESFQTYNRSKIQPASTVITDHYICNGTHMRVDDGQHC